METLITLTPQASDLQIKEYLDSLLQQYNCESFIADDPISVPHRFSDTRDIEISGFLASTIAWGQRRTIVRNAHSMIERMDNAPFDFVINHQESDLAKFDGFVHRTFNDFDFKFFITSLRNIYTQHGGIGDFFQSHYAITHDLRPVLSDFRSLLLGPQALPRTTRHISNIDKNATCKRLAMYLKWMVRHDNNGVDFGIWNTIPMSALYLPLDVHCANVSRTLGLLTRTQNDWQAVEEVTAALKRFDPEDPIKYDFALFSAGIHGIL